MSDKDRIKKELRREIGNRKSITCCEAHSIACRLVVEPIEVGKVCEELKIKIVACQLGCFK